MKLLTLADIVYTPFNPADIEMKSVDLSIGRAVFGCVCAIANDSPKNSTILSLRRLGLPICV